MNTCICRGKILQIEPSDNPPTIAPVYGGLVFRAHGNFGSGIFDPFPRDNPEMLQIIICDECIKNKVEWVTRIYNIKRDVTADAEPFKSIVKVI